ncbi:MAG: bifunctional 4-hydroxy-2-oxoglutarate aldolase/2-dehydro-3-deoxy-phosphogluconate aldolase [Cyclobacteriaceae bacterium]|nr:bifunctional 4-hydroxy-2-oxoglutarate aldolase/2-dehydro-3-deoxy-phosphogluconate aldolase [Cyclobacteriaceae bacterium]
MERIEILNNILDGGIIAIVRVKDAEKVMPTAKAILAGGIHTIEVTMNTPKALDCISELSEIEGIIPGVGTVTNAEMAASAIHAGAEFVVTPVTKKEIIDVCHKLGKPVFSGAFSPGEIFQAYEWGADVIKVFPAETLGMKYIKALKAPFPQIKLMPTGGVTSENIDSWYDMGAVCVGVGGSLTNVEIINNAEWGRLTKIAKKFATNIEHYKFVKPGK